MFTDNRTQTTLGKELTVYIFRLYNSVMKLLNNKPTAKFSGSAGNYLEMMAAFPNVDWILMCHDFVEDTMGLKYLSIVSEIETCDYATNTVDLIRNFNNILKELNYAIRLYCEKGYLVKRRTKNVKVDVSIFDSCTDILEKSNQACLSFSNEFSHNRKITDVGVAINYSVQAIKMTMSNFKKLSVKRECFFEEMNGEWEVLEKPINTAFAVHGVKDAFYQLKESVGGRKLTGYDVRSFISSSDVLYDEQKKFLLSLTPTNYIGYAAGITDIIFRQIMGKDVHTEQEDEEDGDIDEFNFISI